MKNLRPLDPGHATWPTSPTQHTTTRNSNTRNRTIGVAVSVGTVVPCAHGSRAWEQSQRPPPGPPNSVIENLWTRLGLRPVSRSPKQQALEQPAGHPYRPLLLHLLSHGTMHTHGYRALIALIPNLVELSESRRFWALRSPKLCCTPCRASLASGTCGSTPVGSRGIQVECWILTGRLLLWLCLWQLRITLYVCGVDRVVLSSLYFTSQMAINMLIGLEDS
jgi:hypothetical protein